MRPFIFVPIVVAAAGQAASAQQVPVKTLAKPTAEYSEPFSQLAGLAELRDGRVVTADTKDKTLQAVDLRAGKATPIGREGAGPQEWALPLGVYQWLADSVIVNDALNSRYLIVGPDAKPVRTWSPIADAVSVTPPGTTTAPARGAAGAAGAQPPAGATVVPAPGGRGGGGRGGPRISTGLSLRGVDVKGRIYTQDPSIIIKEDGTIASADSAPIVRVDPVSNKRDTIAYVNLPKNNASGSARGDGAGRQTVSLRIGGSTPFAAADDWTVFRDGTVAIVRTANYHVELYPPAGGRVVGKPVAYTPVKVMEADKQQWRDAQKNRTTIGRTIGGPGGNSNASTQLPPPEEPASWPETKPPFQGSASYAAPNGDVWVVRTRSAADPVPSADVFNAQGQLIGRVLFPEKTRLVSLGANGAYLVRSDDDDLQYLQRHAIQWSGCSPQMKEVCTK